MRYIPKIADCGVDLGSFSLSLCFSCKLDQRGATTIHLYQTFVFFANVFIDENGEKTTESLLPAENYANPDKDLPTMVYFAIAKKRGDIARENNIQSHDITIFYPHSEDQLVRFEKGAQAQAKDFARIATEQKAHARKLSNTAQSGLNNDVLYIS